MWRDQVNYFTRQIIKCFFLFSFFLFFFFGSGQEGEWREGSVQDPGVIFMKKIFLKLILCQNVFCKRSTHAMYLKQELIRTYFHMWLCILPLRGQTWFLFFGIGHQPNSVTTVLLHYEVVSSFWRNHCIVGLHFCLYSCSPSPWCGPLLPPAVWKSFSTY